jgi:hypothetical protein
MIGIRSIPARLLMRKKTPNCRLFIDGPCWTRTNDLGIKSGCRSFRAASGRLVEGVVTRIGYRTRSRSVTRVC